MKSVLELFRLIFDNKVSQRAAAKAVGASRSTVKEYEDRFRASGLTWPLPAGLGEQELLIKLFPCGIFEKQAPDFSLVEREMRRKGVTLQLLWKEYCTEAGEDAYQYSRYCELYVGWRRGQRLSMRQHHRGGAKMFVDFSGDPLFIVLGGVRVPVRLFVGVLGASSMTFACATRDETLGSWLEGMTGAVEFFGGVTRFVVPDNPRALVTKTHRYEPVLTDTSLAWAEHYQTCLTPARARRPKDKAKVEVGVQVAQRWIGAVLRNHAFHSLASLNQAIGVLLELLNQRLMRHLGASRAELYASLDQPHLQPLPVNRFVMFTVSKARVAPNYHVGVEQHFYSVPYIHRGKVARISLMLSTVEIAVDGICVATHARSHTKFHYTTSPEHMPKEHQAMLEQSSLEVVLVRAQAVGPSAYLFCKELTLRRPHPEHAINSILRILALQKTYSSVRMDAACGRALHFRMLEARAIAAILKDGLDQLTLPQRSEDAAAPPPEYANLRGKDYFLH